MTISNLSRKFFAVLCMGLSFFVPKVICQVRERAELQGTVTDSAGYVVSEAKVLLKSDSNCFKTITSDSGKYSFKIVSGVYTIYVTADKLGFAPVKRGPFKVQTTQNNELNIRFRLPHVIPGQYQDREKKPYDDVPLSYPKTEDLPIGDSSEVKMGQVTYGTKKVKSGNIIYETVLYSPNENTLDQRTTFSFDFFAVTADKIRVDSKSQIIVATGKPIIEQNGNRMLHTKDVKFRIENGRVKLLD